MPRMERFIALLIVVAATGCQAIPWQERVYREEDCPTCQPTQGRIPVLRKLIPLSACRGGCGEVYWGEWRGDPPDTCNPCNCAHCGTHGDCGECAGCSPAPSGPFSALTMRALTGGRCDTPGCYNDRGLDANPLPSRAVYYHDQHYAYADRSNYGHARTSPAPGTGAMVRNQATAAQRVSSTTQSGSRPGFMNYGYAVDEMNWDVMGSAGSGGRRTGNAPTPRPMVAGRSVPSSYPTTEPVTVNPRGMDRGETRSVWR